MLSDCNIYVFAFRESEHEKKMPCLSCFVPLGKAFSSVCQTWMDLDIKRLSDFSMGFRSLTYNDETAAWLAFRFHSSFVKSTGIYDCPRRIPLAVGIEEKFYIAGFLHISA